MPNASVILLSALVASRTLAAQALPLGEHRPWIEVGLGGSNQDPSCAACRQPGRMGGPSASLSMGVTMTQSFGVAILLRKFTEFSFEYGHDANYLVGLAQYSPYPGIILNGGLGTGSQNGDHPPYGDNGSGTVVSGGIALRFPEKSTFGLTVTLDWIKTVSGTLRTAGQPGSSYRPLLFTLGLGLNIAGSSDSW